MKVLVKAPNWLGDAVMGLPLLSSLRAMDPGGSVAVLTRAAFADLYRGAPADEVLIHERGGLGAFLRTVGEIKRRAFDAAVVVPRSFSAAFVVFAARIPRRIGYRGRGRSLLLTDGLTRPRDRRHRVHEYHHLLSALGTPPAVEPPRIDLQPEAVAWAEQALPGGPWIGLNPGATYGAAKQWFPDRFVELARRLSSGARIAVVGGPAEAELGRRVAESVGGTCLAGSTTVSQLAAAIARCRLFVTNDTGPLHVADAVGTPVVAVFGPTDWIETPPFRPGHAIVRHALPCAPCKRRVCPLGHHDCMKRVTVEDVEAACRARLAP